MPTPIFIGDEVTAAGYRLAGLRVRVPERGRAAEALREALRDAPLVLITAQAAAEVPGAELGAALSAVSPLTLVVADVCGLVPVPDRSAALRRDLGADT